MMAVGTPERSARPSFRQIPSLLTAPIADIDEVRRGDICMVGLFEDHAEATGFGARFAARQIRYASQNDTDPGPTTLGVRILDLGDLNVFPLERDRNDGALIRQLRSLIERGAVPVVVGGAFRMGPLLRQILTQAAAREIAQIELPDAANAVVTAAKDKLVVLTLDLSRLHEWSTMSEKPLAHLRQSIGALSPGLIGAVHLTGLAPDLDLCGRHEASLGHHVLKIVVAHLGRVGA